MKKYLILVGFTLLLLGCQKLYDLTYFQVEFDESVTIKSAVGGNLPFNFLTPDIETNADSTFEIIDDRKKYIEEIILEKLDLKITSPSNADFSFLKNIKIYISSEGIDETLVAWKDEIPDDTNKIDLKTTGKDLQAYIKADQFALRLSIETDEILTSDHTIDIHSEFFVNLTIFASDD